MALSALRLIAALGLVTAALSACMPSAMPEVFDGDDSEEGSGKKGGTKSGGTNGGSTSGGGGVDDTIDFGTSGSDPGGLEGCATSNETATLVPVNMFVTVDRSGSMNDDQKWANAKAAFIAFFQDPEAASLRVALRFWPDDGCDANTCNVNVCATPAVDVGPLSDPGHVQDLVDRFNAKSPNGNTPMSAALAGATQWASNFMGKTEGTEKAVVVLVTDGEPNGCDENVSNIAAIAKDAYDDAGVQTFAVGLAGSNQLTMDQIAEGGGTSAGFFIGNGNAKAELIEALKKIQASSVACVYAMPKPTAGEVLDPHLVNVNYTPGEGKTQTFGQVDNAGACGSVLGWYYDDPANPSIINLCPKSCDLVQADPGAKMQIVLGCATLPG